jgi:hypothetical protein
MERKDQVDGELRAQLTEEGWFFFSFFFLENAIY